MSDAVAHPGGGGADVVVRRARPSDLRRISSVEASGDVLFREHLGETLMARVPALSAAPPSGSERDADGALLVAVVQRRIVGFAHVIDRDGHAHLEQLSVLPSEGRRGTGTRLVRAAMEEARWAGYDTMSLCTYRDVPWNAPFYARLGFREVAQLLPFHRDLRAAEQAMGLDDAGPRVVMSRRLTREVTDE